MFKKSIFIVIFMLMICLLGFAQVPQIINYQALLTDAKGSPINGGSTIQFRIYDSITDGNALWSETQTVTITDGLFNVLLGSINPLTVTIFSEPEKYLGIKVGSDPEMMPRKRIVSVAYAMASSQVSGASNIFPSDGNVGIGTTAPGSKLEVSDAIAITGKGLEGGQLSLIDGDKQGGWEIDNYGGSGNEALVSNTIGSGNTAIGNFALWRNSANSGNTALGAGAGRYASRISAGTFIGYGPGIDSGDEYYNATASGIIQCLNKTHNKVLANSVEFITTKLTT